MKLNLSHFEPGTGDAVKAWAKARISPVWPREDEHSLHSYFNIPPESPDGRRVLVFSSERDDAQIGALSWIDRESGETLRIVENLEVEDAHRLANQQWVCGGKYIVYMEYSGGEWFVHRVEADRGKDEILCEGREAFFGTGNLPVVPLFGMHWNPRGHCDLELLDVESGDIRTVVAVGQVVNDFPDFVAEIFGNERPDSIAFPVISPDGSRVFFKLSKVNDGKFRSDSSSRREGIFIYETATARPIGCSKCWRHPSWLPDSRRVSNTFEVLDTDTMSYTPIPWYPKKSNTHGSPSPDGELLAFDVAREGFTEKELHWAVIVGNFRDSWVSIHTDTAERHGTTSWRPAHSHPVFSADGKRLYFNANFGKRTRLLVADTA